MVGHTYNHPEASGRMVSWRLAYTTHRELSGKEPKQTNKQAKTPQEK